jgi:sedoheptulokinase
MGKMLGIDIGTTKVAAVIFDLERGMLEHASIETKADVLGLPAEFAEQDVAKIANALDKCVLSLSATERKEVVAVGVTGQMHGVVLWDTDNNNTTSNLFTWQDKRCEADCFIAKIAESGGGKLKSGFGAATLSWMKRNGVLNPIFQNSGTIMDWLVVRLCGLTHGVMDPTNAASWGVFDLDLLDWNWNIVDALLIPRHLMPEIVPTGTIAGNLTVRSAESWGLSSGIPVTVAIGDNQASLLATLKDWDDEVALTLGTGAQISAVAPKGFKGEFDVACDIRPFVDERLIIVGAPLCGGSAFAWLIKWFGGWCDAFGIKRPDDKRLYELFIESGLVAESENLRIEPHFLGERNDVGLRGQISGIDLRNFTPGKFSKALAEGIAVNLKSMLPDRLLSDKKRIITSGNALRRNALLMKAVGEVFAMPVELIDSVEEAACGAAILAKKLNKQ